MAVLCWGLLVWVTLAAGTDPWDNPTLFVALTLIAIFLASLTPVSIQGLRARSYTVTPESVTVEQGTETVRIPWPAIEFDASYRLGNTIVVRYRTQFSRWFKRVERKDWNWIADAARLSGVDVPSSETIRVRSSWRVSREDREFLKALRTREPAPFVHSAVSTKNVTYARRFGEFVGLEFFLLSGFLSLLIFQVLREGGVAVGVVLGAAVATWLGFRFASRENKARKIVDLILWSLVAGLALLMVLIALSSIGIFFVELPLAYLFVLITGYGIVIFLPVGAIAGAYASPVVSTDDVRIEFARWPRS